MLKCVQYDEVFPDRSMLKPHVLINHDERHSTCGNCDKTSEVKQPIKEHVIRDNLQKRLHELSNRITNQKIKLYEDLFVLKKRDMVKKGNCNCKGSFCRINHAKFRWKVSKTDEFFSRLLSISPGYHSLATGSNCYECDKCEKTYENKEIMNNNSETNHVQKDLGAQAQESILGSISYECEMCENMLDDTNDLQNHMETEHSHHFKCKLCDSEFSNDISLGKHIDNEHLSTHKCKKCDRIFIKEKDLGIHISANHAENLLESTFFNPSAVN